MVGMGQRKAMRTMNPEEERCLSEKNADERSSAPTG